jgi:hypothetical protein
MSGYMCGFSQPVGLRQSSARLSYSQIALTRATPDAPWSVKKEKKMQQLLDVSSFSGRLHQEARG